MEWTFGKSFNNPRAEIKFVSLAVFPELHVPRDRNLLGEERLPDACCGAYSFIASALLRHISYEAFGYT